MKIEKFYAIDGNILYYGERDLNTGDITYGEVVWEYFDRWGNPSALELFIDLSLKGLPKEPVYF